MAQRICQINDLVKKLMGAMLMKIVILSRENESHMAKNSVFWKFWSQNGTKNMSDQWFSQKFDGGDVDENRHFIDGKWVAHGQKIQYFENFDHKMAIFF